MNTKTIQLQKTSNQENDYIIVEAIDQNGNFLFDVSYNADSEKYEVLFGNIADGFTVQFDALIEKLSEAMRLVEEDVQKS
jgi:hypothetical protein